MSILRRVGPKEYVGQVGKEVMSAEESSKTTTWTQRSLCMNVEGFLRNNEYR